MKKKKGFTLVELLAVIVILAVILVIAVPQIMSVIESARKGSIESTAKLIAEGAEREYTNRKILGKDTNVLCSDVSSMNSNDYGTCVITFDNRGKATVKVTGKGKFEGYTCNGNSTNMECVKGEIPGSTETAAQYFSYSEVDGGITITDYKNGIAEVIIKDKDKCVAYLPTIGATEEEANTLCSGNALDDGMTLKDVVRGGYIPSSDYATAGLEVTSKPFNRITDVVIPNEIDGKKVVEISANAFSGKALTSIFMPNTIISIGKYAFSVNQLTEVTIPSSVTSIGYGAFMSNQLTSLTILDGVTSIGYGAFMSNQLTSLIIPNSVTSIGEYAFFRNQLTEVTIPSSVTSIGDNAFSSNQLTSLTILDGVTSIGRNAFSIGCGTDRCTNNVCTCIKVSGNENLSKIINKTGRSFDWDAIINNTNEERYTFETGSVSSDNKANWNVEITK